MKDAPTEKPTETGYAEKLLKELPLALSQTHRHELCLITLVRQNDEIISLLKQSEPALSIQLPAQPSGKRR